MVHVWYIYLHENHKNQPNVGEYTSPTDPRGTHIETTEPSFLGWFYTQGVDQTPPGGVFGCL